MLSATTRPNPTTPGDYHSALVPHLGHDLAVRSNREQEFQVVVVQCASSDGRVSLTARPDEAPVDEARWRPHLSAPLYFAGRSIGCRTCQMPVAR
ncbi:hypothetical protein ACFYPA_05910 [Streptomyces sp. NPDC005775]|uniref:hypothetical protein n=1 Tax=Streptomyces sp. NPDC005775 TaxID=3364729 RepID=UPI0036821C37